MKKLTRITLLLPFVDDVTARESSKGAAVFSDLMARIEARTLSNKDKTYIKGSSMVKNDIFIKSSIAVSF